MSWPPFGMAAFLQGGPSVDPAAYGAAQWGVLGALVFVIVILGLIIYSLFIKQQTNQSARDQTLISFIDRHRGETTAAMKGVADTMAKSLDEIREALVAHGRTIDAVYVTTVAAERAKRMKQAGEADLSPAETNALIRDVISELYPRGRLGGG